MRSGLSLVVATGAAAALIAGWPVDGLSVIHNATEEHT